MATTVTSKGQVTIPKSVRDYLGVKPGNRVEFRRAEDGHIIVERFDGVRRSSKVAALRGHAGPGLTTDEIMAMTRGEADDPS